MKRYSMLAILAISMGALLFTACSGGSKNGALTSSSDAASRVYVAPGELDEFYGFFSGGFSGQLSAYGLPSGRLLKVIPVFSVDAEKAYGFSEETKPLLETSWGFVPWDEAHHPSLSRTDGAPDGRWIFIPKPGNSISEPRKSSNRMENSRYMGDIWERTNTVRPNWFRNSAIYCCINHWKREYGFQRLMAPLEAACLWAGITDNAAQKCV